MYKLAFFNSEHYTFKDAQDDNALHVIVLADDPIDLRSGTVADIRAAIEKYTRAQRLVSRHPVMLVLLKDDQIIDFETL